MPVTSEAYREVLGSFMPLETAAFLTDLFPYVLDGHNAHVDSDIERVLGRRPREFAAYARAAAQAGAWAR